MNECESNEDVSVKDKIIMWCESNGRYDILEKIQLIPEEESVFKKLLLSTPNTILGILEREGY